MATKAQIAEFTTQALDAYYGGKFDGLLTSDMHAAHCLGQHLRDTGRPEPRDVRPGRGDLFHANDMVWRFNWSHVRFPTITRER